MEGLNFLLEMTEKFGQPPLARILSPDDQRADNMHSVLRGVQQQHKNSAFIKLYCPEIKRISFVPRRNTSDISLKVFHGFGDGDFLGKISLEDIKSERLSSFMKSSQEKGVVTESQFYEKYYQEGKRFKYLESMENPMKVLENPTSFDWIENLEQNCGIPGTLPGISTPWLYIGQEGSMFPWHAEDGNLLSLNFHLQGAPKIWYGVQPQYIEKVEQILKAHPAAKECESFFRHKHSFIDPSYLQSQGIPIYSVTQQPGDIVIPMSFHQGFNLGMNVSVAINKFSGSTDLLKHRVASHCKPKPFCQYETKSNYIQKVFMYLHQDEIPCTLCPRTYTSKKGLNIHMKTKHNMLLEDDNGNRKCPICDKVFAQLDSHLKNKHEDEMPQIFCCLCRVPFQKLKLVKKHWNEDHKDDKKCLSCKFVAKTFDQIIEDHGCGSKRARYS